MSVHALSTPLWPWPFRFDRFSPPRRLGSPFWAGAAAASIVILVGACVRMRARVRGNEGGIEEEG